MALALVVACMVVLTAYKVCIFVARNVASKGIVCCLYTFCHLLLYNMQAGFFKIKQKQIAYLFLHFLVL